MIGLPMKTIAYLKFAIPVALLLFLCSCIDMENIIGKTEYFTLSAENLYEPDSLANTTFWDSTSVKSMLDEKSVNTIQNIWDFEVLVPARYSIIDKTEGTFRFPVGKAEISEKIPGFRMFSVHDNFIPHQLVGINMANFFYIPSDSIAPITIADEIARIEGDIIDNTIFYSDKNSVIFGEEMEYSVVYINHLKEQKVYEVFRSDQKSTPFMELSDQDLFAIAVAKLKLAKNFHATAENPIENDWKNINGLISRHQKKLFVALRDFTIEVSPEIPVDRAIQYDLDDYDLDALIIRDSTAKATFDELSGLPVEAENTIVFDSLSPSTKAVLDQLFYGKNFEVIKTNGKGFVLSEDGSQHIIYYYPDLEVPYLLCLSPQGLNKDMDGHIDFYFELLARLKGLKV